LFTGCSSGELGAALHRPKPAVRRRGCLLGYAQEEPMPRRILDESRIHPAIREGIATLNAAIVDEVQAAIGAHSVVLVGMAQNPFVRKARRVLDAAGVRFHYLGYGSYFSDWRRRNALKMWTGWPTFPMVFVKGTLVGGAEELERLIASGELKRLLA
jgi:monothiol glutaredoxin